MARNKKRKITSRAYSHDEAKDNKRTFEKAGYKCEIVKDISQITRHYTGIYWVFCERRRR